MTQHPKPIGETGVIRVVVSPKTGGGNASYIKNVFPKTKRDQEQHVLEAFVLSMKNAGANIHNYHLNESEDDFDCTLNVGNKEKIYLELKELVIPTEKGSPYQQSNQLRDAGEIADWILNSVVLKYNRKYGNRKPSDTPLHLLLYTTDWKFTVSDNVIALVQYYLHQRKTVFENIFLLQFLDQDNVERCILYPTPAHDWVNFDASQYRESKYLNIDPNKWS